VTVDVEGYIRMMRLSIQHLECIPLYMVIEGSRRNIDIDCRMQGQAKDKEVGRGNKCEQIYLASLVRLNRTGLV
jgi:hypothetical protein